MELHERIRYLRKDYLKMSQEKFGMQLGVSRDVIKNIELNLLAKPEQKEPLIKLICREFNVDYIWLTTGEGEIFSESDDQVLALIDRVMSGENNFTKRVFKAFAAFDESDWKTLEKFVDIVASSEDGEKK